MGRLHTINKKQVNEILKSIALRVPYKIAAEAAGICEKTLYSWLNQGAEDVANKVDSEHARLLQSIKKIERDLIAHHMQKIGDNVERWQGDAWILERRWYKLFGSSAHLIELQDRMDKLEEMERKAKHAKQDDAE